MYHHFPLSLLQREIAFVVSCRLPARRRCCTSNTAELSKEKRLLLCCNSFFLEISTSRGGQFHIWWQNDYLWKGYPFYSKFGDKHKSRFHERSHSTSQIQSFAAKTTGAYGLSQSELPLFISRLRQFENIYRVLRKFIGTI